MSATTISAAVPLAAEWLTQHDARAIAVLLPGSGPIDRNGNAPKLPLDIQRQLAEGLGERSVASIRWDKRGVGESGGDFLSTGLHDLVDDALTVIDEATRTGLPVVLIGHSEGTAIAARLLVERPGITGAVLLSPYARSGLEVLRWQSRALAQDIPAPVRGVLRLLRTDLESQTEKNRRRLLATTGDVERVGGVRLNARWFREFMAYDPLVDLSAAEQPVLAIAAGYDLQSPPEDAEAIVAARSASTWHVLLDGVSHILRRQPAATMRTYRRDARTRIDERIIPLISAWIEQVTADGVVGIEAPVASTRRDERAASGGPGQA